MSCTISLLFSKVIGNKAFPFPCLTKFIIAANESISITRCESSLLSKVIFLKGQNSSLFISKASLS